MENRKNLLINVLYFSVLLVIGYLLLKYVLIWFLPFLIGFLFGCAVNALSKKLCKNTGFSRKLCSLIIIAVVYLTILAFVVLFSSELILETQERISKLPIVYNTSIAPLIDSINDWGRDFLPNLKTIGILDTVKDGAENMLISFSGKAVNFFTAFIYI